MSVIISLITTLVAFLFVLNSNTFGGESSRQKIKAIAFLIGILAACASLYQIIFRWLVVIPAGEVGVVEVLGNVSDKTLKPGIHWVNPLGKVIEFSTRLEDLKETVDVTSKEGLSFQLDVSLQYRLNPKQAANIYQKLGTEEEEIIISRFRSLIRQITSSYNLQAIYGEKRLEIANSLRQALSQQLNPLGFVVEEVLLRNVILPENIQASIQQKVAAEQDNEKLEVEIEKTRKEAQKRKIEAQGTADSQKILSQGLTDKILQLKAIEATQKLAESQNSKIIIMGGGDGKLPLILPEK